MGKLFIGKVWKKKRPMIEIEKEGVVYHAAISHSQEEGMIELNSEDLTEGTNFPTDGTYAGLSNKSRLKLLLGQMGGTKDEFDEKLLVANPKLQEKTAKRNKKK